MAANLFVLVLASSLLLVVPPVVGLVAYLVLRPGDGEPRARARLRRGAGTGAAVAASAALLVLLPSLLLSLRAPGAGAVGVALAGLLHVAVLWCWEAVTARPHAGRRTALLLPDDRPPARTALTVLLGASVLGLLGLLGLVLVDAAGSASQTPGVTTIAVVAAVAVVVVAMAALVVLAVRQVDHRTSDPRLDPEVDAGGRARTVHRVLRSGASAACASLGLLLLAAGQRDQGGDGTTLAALVLGGVLLAVAAAALLLPLPALPMRPDRDAGVVDPVVGAGSGAGAG